MPKIGKTTQVLVRMCSNWNKLLIHKTTSQALC